MPDPSQRAEGILARADLVRTPPRRRRRRHGHRDTRHQLARRDVGVRPPRLTPSTENVQASHHFDGVRRQLPVAGRDRRTHRRPQTEDGHPARGLSQLPRPRPHCSGRSPTSAKPTSSASTCPTSPADKRPCTCRPRPTNSSPSRTGPPNESPASTSTSPATCATPIVAILHATRAASLHPATISDEICHRWATTGHPTCSSAGMNPTPS